MGDGVDAGIPGDRPHVRIEVVPGTTVDFECEPTISSVWVATDVLKGETYPHLPFVDDVRVIVDVGANCGAASVFFALHHPGAVVHAFEPAAAPRVLLERNTAGLDVRVHPFGLYSEDGEVPFYAGAEGASILGSVFPREVNAEATETVRLRDAAAWAAEEGVDRIDVLKVDVEGSEVHVLESLRPLLPTVKVVYVEYGSRALRRRVFELLEPTHEVYLGRLLLDQGECVFLRHDLLDVPGAIETLRDLFRARFSPSG